MKRIAKGAEPADFSEWKEQDGMAHRPNWNRVPGPVREKVHDSLLQEQGFICCYCEMRVERSNSHIEHFRPKSKSTYAERQLDYSNLHCSCQRDSSPGEPRHCGHRKGSWFDENLLISPMEPDCEVRFKFTANGDIFSRLDDDAGAKATIQRLRLDLPKLRSLRAAAVDGLYDLPKADIRCLLDSVENGRFLEFYTTIKQVLSDT